MLALDLIELPLDLDEPFLLWKSENLRVNLGHLCQVKQSNLWLLVYNYIICGVFLLSIHPKKLMP